MTPPSRAPHIWEKTLPPHPQPPRPQFRAETQSRCQRRQEHDPDQRTGRGTKERVSLCVHSPTMSGHRPCPLLHAVRTSIIAMPTESSHLSVALPPPCESFASSTTARPRHRGPSRATHESRQEGRKIHSRTPCRMGFARSRPPATAREEGGIPRGWRC